jgi:hypothetical protein
MVPFRGGWGRRDRRPQMPVKAARSPRESLVKTQWSEITDGDGQRYPPANRHHACVRIERTRENLRRRQGDRSEAVGAHRGGVTRVGWLGEGRDRARARDYSGHDEGAQHSGCEPLKVSREFHDAALQARLISALELITPRVTRRFACYRRPAHLRGSPAPLSHSYPGGRPSERPQAGSRTAPPAACEITHAGDRRRSRVSAAMSPRPVRGGSRAR